MVGDSFHRLWGAGARVTILSLAFLTLAACQPRPSPPDPVVTAVRNNDVHRVGQYLAEGGDPDRISPTGDPLLYVATGARGGIQVMRVLLIGGAFTESKNSTGRTALHNAAGWCHVPMVVELLDAGADPSAVDEDGKTPLDSVCSGPIDLREEVIALLGGSGG